MKLHSLFLPLSLVVSLHAGDTLIEKYTQIRNDTNLAKIESYRNSILKNRYKNQELRDYEDKLREIRSKATYARIEGSYTPYR